MSGSGCLTIVEICQATAVSHLMQGYRSAYYSVQLELLFLYMNSSSGIASNTFGIGLLLIMYFSPLSSKD